MTDDLAVWLLAQLEVDAQVARDLGGPPASWETGIYVGDHYNYATVVPAGGDEHNRILTCGIDGFGAEDLAAHIALWDPARVLADIDARRRIIAQHRCTEIEDGLDGAWECDHCGQQWNRSGGCPTLRLLALPLADRPGYQDTWRPT